MPNTIVIKFTAAILLLMICASASPITAAENIIRRVCCKNIPASQILPQIQKLIAEGEAAILDEGDNCIILKGNPEDMEQIASVIAMLDKKTPVIRLHIRNFIWTVLENQKAPINWKKNDGNWRVGDMSEMKKAQKVYRAPGKDVIVHSTADASGKYFRVNTGQTLQFILGAKIRADQFERDSRLGDMPIGVFKSREIQPALLITPSVAGKTVMFSIVPATLGYADGKLEIHRHESLAISASCPDNGEILIGAGETGENSLLYGWFKSFNGSGIELDRETGLLISVNIERESTQ